MQPTIFFLILLLPLAHPLYIFENMIEPYLKKPIPTIFLSPNENKYINLNSYYGGSQLTFQFNAFTDPYIKFSYLEGVSNSSNKGISDRPVEFIIFPDQNGLNVSGAMLTDDNKVYSIVITNIYMGESDVSFLSFLKVPDDLICKKMTMVDSMSVLLDCDSTNSTNPPQFLKVDFYMNGTMKNVDQNYIRVSNSYSFKGQEIAYRNCIRKIRYHNNFVYRYCPKSRSNSSSFGGLEIFSVNFTNESATLFNLICSLKTADGTLNLMIQDLQIYDTQDIFILDYHLGLFEVSFTQNDSQVIDNNCPSILGGNYFSLTFDCFDKSGIHDDFQQCKLIVTAAHYITELIYSKSFACRCCFNSRKNLGEDIGTIYETYTSTNFLIVYYAEKNISKNNSLNVYDRNDMNTNILYQLTNLSSESTIRLVTAKTDFYFSTDILNKLIVFTKDDKQLYLINIGQNIVSFACCNNGFPPESLHTAYIDYCVKDLNGNVSRMDRIYIKTILFENTSIFSENNTYSYKMNLTFLNYRAPLLGVLKGSNQQYIVSNLKDLNLSVKQVRTYYPPIPGGDNLLFLKIIKINLNYFFFIQTNDFLVKVRMCLFMNEDIVPTYLGSQMSCWNISHEILLDTAIKDVLSKEDILIVQTSNSSLFSYYFTSQTFRSIKFDRVFKKDDQPLNCSRLLFNLISSHCLCINDTPNNDYFQVSIFVPANSSDHNNSKVQSYNYTNEYPNEVFSYFDQTLLSSDIILAKGPHCIHILKLSYNEDENTNSLKTVMVIDNEYTKVSNDFIGFHFNIVKSALHQKINLLITNYDQNIIAEYSLDDLISPTFIRRYPLFNFTLNSTSYVTTINDAYFMVGCFISNDTNPNNLYYLIYDVFESTESSLVKVITTDQSSKIYLVLDRNQPIMNAYSYETYEINFLIFNRSQPNQGVFQQYRPVSLHGYLGISNVQKSITLDESTQTYTVESNYDETANFTYNITVSNSPLSNQTKNITHVVKFDYSSTIIGYSQYYLKNPKKNLSILDLSETDKVSLPIYYDGPVVTYRLENDKPSSSSWKLRTFMDFNSDWNISDKIAAFNNKTQTNYSLSNDSRTTLLAIPTDSFLFLLKEFTVFMLNLSAIDESQFDVIDVFDLRKIIDEQLQWCNVFETDYKNLSNTNLYLGCQNVNEEPLLYVLLYDKKGFNKQIREILINGLVSNINSLKIMDNFVYVVNQGVGNSNDCAIFIFQIDLPIVTQNNSTESTSTIIPLTNLYILNAQSFNVDYLYIFDFEINCFGNLNGSYIYGIILNDQYALYYCEISLDPNKKIDNFYNKSVSDFVLQSNTELNKLDLRSLLNLTFRNAEGAPSITCYWLDSNIFGEMFILISTTYELIELKTSRFYFSGYFQVYQDFQEYSECLNNQQINTRAALHPNFLAFPCILSPPYSPMYSTYLKLYSKNADISNSSKVPINQMLIFPASKFNDFFFVEGESNTKIFVINDTAILEYDIYENLYIERTMLNRTIPGHETNTLILTAVNNISIAKVKIHVNNGFFIDNDWVSFYALVVAPLIFCFFGIVVLFSVIKYSRNKRKGMLLKLRDD